MFGYVIPNQAALDDESKARYRTAYCGLCRRIGALHGLRSRLTLSYDLTFLDLLLSSLYEGESECVTGKMCIRDSRNTGCSAEGPRPLRRADARSFWRTGPTAARRCPASLPRSRADG